MRVDIRAGSKELIKPLRAVGVVVDESTLPAGDVEIVGNGPDGGPTLVGVEYKTIEDAAQCMRNGRFAEQARGMKANFQVSWLLVEGRIKIVGRDLMVRKGPHWKLLHAGVSYQELAAWMTTMAQANGILLWRTEDRAETVEWLRVFNNWWTAKQWEGIVQDRHAIAAVGESGTRGLFARCLSRISPEHLATVGAPGSDQDPLYRRRYGARQDGRERDRTGRLQHGTHPGGCRLDSSLAHGMERELAGEDESRFNLKKGRGGLVDIEFLTQMLQLAHGHRITGVRQRETLAALKALAAAKILKQREYQLLADRYLFLRQLDHRLRLERDQSLYAFDAEPGRLDGIAKALGYSKPSNLRSKRI